MIYSNTNMILMIYSCLRLCGTNAIKSRTAMLLIPSRFFVFCQRKMFLRPGDSSGKSLKAFSISVTSKSHQLPEECACATALLCLTSFFLANGCGCGCHAFTLDDPKGLYFGHRNGLEVLGNQIFSPLPCKGRNFTAFSSALLQSGLGTCKSDLLWASSTSMV